MIGRFFILFVTGLLTASFVTAQGTPAIQRIVYYDHNGRSVTTEEFVDIRMANFHYPDATIVKTLDDGTVEFRLQKIPQEGEKAPEVLFKTLDGDTVDLAKLKGKVVVLNFWFIGCASCLAHQPKLNQLKAKFDPDADVVFLAATADPRQDVKRYLSKEKFHYLQAADAEVPLKAFRFSGYPRNIVISKTGEIVYWRTSVKAWDKFETVIRAELAK